MRKHLLLAGLLLATIATPVLAGNGANDPADTGQNKPEIKVVIKKGRDTALNLPKGEEKPVGKPVIEGRGSDDNGAGNDTAFKFVFNETDRPVVELPKFRCSIVLIDGQKYIVLTNTGKGAAPEYNSIKIYDKDGTQITTSWPGSDIPSGGQYSLPYYGDETGACNAVYTGKAFPNQ